MYVHNAIFCSLSKGKHRFLLIEKIYVMHCKVLKEITELYVENGYFYRKIYA